MKTRYIQLFEDYTKSMNVNGSETTHTWTQVRDSIQMKRPFVIIIFKDKESQAAALNSELSKYDCIKQSAMLNLEGKHFTFPSLFFTLDQDTTFEPMVKTLYNKFKIDSIITGKPNSEFAELYSDDGTSVDFGNEIVSTLSPDDFSTDDYFKVGSTYYRFINFAS